MCGERLAGDSPVEGELRDGALTAACADEAPEAVTRNEIVRFHVRDTGRGGGVAPRSMTPRHSQHARARARHVSSYSPTIGVLRVQPRRAGLLSA